MEGRSWPLWLVLVVVLVGMMVAYIDLRGQLTDLRQRLDGHLAWHSGPAAQPPGHPVPEPVPVPVPEDVPVPVPDSPVPQEPAPPTDPLTIEDDTARETPTRDEIMRAMQALQPAVHACAEHSGIAVVRITFRGRDGRVSDVEARVDEPRVRRCIERAVRTASLGPFSRESMSVSFPFRLPGPAEAAPTGEGEAGAGLTAAQIRQVVSANQRDAQRCYEELLRSSDQAPSGRVALSLVIGPSGSVTEAQVSAATPPELGTCVAGEARRWRFPAAEGETRTTIPFVFASGG